MQYRVLCVTDSKYEFIWLEDGDPVPSVCPVNTNHTIDSDRINIIQVIPNATVTDENGHAIVAPTYQNTQGLKAVWKGYLYTATAGILNIFDELINTEIKISSGYYQLVAPLDSPEAVIGDYVEMSIIDKDNISGLFSLYGLVARKNEVQTITFSAVPSGGMYTLSHDSNITGNISYDSDAATVQTALRALSSLSEVTVSGNTSVGFTVTFAGEDGYQTQPQLTSDFSSLTGATISHATAIEGYSGDILELAKHVKKEYINPFSPERQPFESAAAQDVIAGLYFRFYYNSTGSENVTFKVLSFYHEM